MIENEEILSRIQEIFNKLEINKIKENNQKPLPKSSGLYFFFAKKEIKIGFIEDKEYKIKENEISYIGKAENLFERINKKHLQGKISKSTLRMTLATILSNLGKKFIWEKKKTKYYINEEDEKYLSDWIKNNFKISFCEVYEDTLDLAESVAVYKYNPPLNIDKKPKSNQLTGYISDLRKKIKKTCNGFTKE